MSKLRLGALDEDKPVKLSVEFGGALMRELRTYAEVHAKLTGLGVPLPPERLVPAMVERFIAGDREFSKQRRRG